ncbi:MAG: transcriptional repressor [Spirosomataceae bacterium]
MSIEKVKQILEQELEKRNLRKTTERFTILEEIYGRNDHFDVEDLYDSLLNKNFHVSRATVYNTLDMLVDCGLVKKHRFNSDGAVFEKALGFRQHGHLVCNECNHIKEFCDPRLQAIQDNVGEALGFNITDQALVFYGACSDDNCENRLELMQRVENDSKKEIKG